MSTWPQIPLEDEYADIVRKAARGRGMDVAALPYDDVKSVARILHLDASALQASYDASWAPPPIVTDDVRHHPQLPHPSNGYVFFLDGGKRAALVDPAGVPSRLLAMLRDGAYHLQYILITHKHADHCDATGDVAAAFPDARIVMNALDVHAIGALADRALKVRDGEALPFGDDCEIRALHTPGHTDGSTSYLLRSNVFTGDTLFAGSVGGAYGDASTYADVLNSVRSKLFTLPDETIVMPGHGPPTTIALEKAHNPFFPREHHA